MLRNKVVALLAGASLFEAEYRAAMSCEKRRGRTDERELTVMVSCNTDLPAYLGFAGVGQVFRLVRRTRNHKSSATREQTIWGLTSLSAAQASPERLLRLVRGHWGIENRSHWVRDVTFDEDKSQVRVGNLPQVLATLRNTAISLIRLTGCKNVAAACRRFAAKPGEAVALLGINRTE